MSVNENLSQILVARKLLKMNGYNNLIFLLICKKLLLAWRGIAT